MTEDDQLAPAPLAPTQTPAPAPRARPSRPSRRPRAGSQPARKSRAPRQPARANPKPPSAKPRPAKARAAKARASTGKQPPLTRATADRLALYTKAVQSPDAEIDFVTKTFRKLAGRPLRRLREDFCGAGASVSEFVRRHPENTGVGLDLHGPTLRWGMKHAVGALPEDARARVQLLQRNVLEPGPEGAPVDAVLAMNFSYWIFQTRDLMRTYFERVRASLAPGGVFFMDAYGGWEASKIQQERRWVSFDRGRRFRYVWDQKWFDPLHNRMKCAIHFEFEKGPAWRNAFTYEWRLWTIQETKELLREAGFKDVVVYWEGDDNKGGGNGVFTPREVGEHCASFITYITARG